LNGGQSLKSGQERIGGGIAKGSVGVVPETPGPFEGNVKYDPKLEVKTKGRKSLGYGAPDVLTLWQRWPRREERIRVDGHGVNKKKSRSIT